MTGKQTQILQKLRQVQTILHHADIDIRSENAEGQFDYCTCPDLSECVLAIKHRSQKIEQIIFQMPTLTD